MQRPACLLLDMFGMGMGRRGREASWIRAIRWRSAVALLAIVGVVLGSEAYTHAIYMRTIGDARLLQGTDRQMHRVERAIASSRGLLEPTDAQAAETTATQYADLKRDLESVTVGHRHLVRHLQWHEAMTPDANSSIDALHRRFEAAVALLLESPGNASESEVVRAGRRYSALLASVSDRLVATKEAGFWDEYRVRWLLTLLAGLMAIGLFWFVLTPGLRRAAADRRRLRDSEALLEAQQYALDSSAIVELSDGSGRIEHVNDNFCEVSGYSRDELLGSTHRILSSGEHDAVFFADLNRTLWLGKAWRGTICNRHKDGSLYWVDTTLVPIMGELGRPERFVGLRTDVTDRLRYQGEIDRLATRLRMATQAADIGVWEFDVQRGELIWDETTHRLFGTLPDARPLSFEFWQTRIDPDDRERASARFWEAIDGSRSFGAIFRIVRPDDTVRHISASAVIERDEAGSAVRVVGVNMDITERVLAELRLSEAKDRSEAASVAKTAFLANISHEIRTPMTAIVGFAELLESDETSLTDPDRLRDIVETIRRNAKHLLALISDVLDVSKIEAGRMQLERIATEPIAIAEEVVAMLRERTESKGVAFRFDISSGVPDRIASDPTRLRQILINLIGNAVKFTERGVVSVQMRVAGSSVGERLLVVDVTDTGVGMTAEQVARLSSFEAFVQADDSMTRRFGGTGLGLKISQALAQLLGGGIEIQSEPTRGSRFTLRIAAPPMSVRDSEVVRGEEDAPQPADHQAQPLQGYRLLLAEDGPDNQRLLSFHLRKAGATVEVAENGRVALDAVRGAEASGMVFDLILMDMQMPEMDGYEATAALRRLGYSLPIVALTAHAMTGDRERCLLAGCDDYATKPIDRASLIALCRRWADTDARPAREAA